MAWASWAILKLIAQSMRTCEGPSEPSVRICPLMGLYANPKTFVIVATSSRFIVRAVINFVISNFPQGGPPKEVLGHQGSIARSSRVDPLWTQVTWPWALHAGNTSFPIYKVKDLLQFARTLKSYPHERVWVVATHDPWERFTLVWLSKLKSHELGTDLYLVQSSNTLLIS